MVAQLRIFFWLIMCLTTQQFNNRHRDPRHYTLIIYALALLLLLLVIHLGLSNKKYANNIGDLILSCEDINKIYIYQNYQDTPLMIITNNSIIGEVISKLSNISIKKLSREEDIKFMHNGQRMLQVGVIWAEFKVNDKIYGKLGVWNDGTIYITDIT